METREVTYDYEVELPSGLWNTGIRLLKMRMRCLATGTIDERNDDRFIVRRIDKVLGHEVEPADWERNVTPRDQEVIGGR